TIYFLHECFPCPRRHTCSGSASSQAASLDRAADALAHVRGGAGHDRERASDLRRLCEVRRAQRTLLCLSVPGAGVSRRRASGRLARGGTQLALRAGVAAGVRRVAVSGLPGREWRMAVLAVPPARPARRDRDAEVLPPAAQG